MIYNKLKSTYRILKYPLSVAKRKLRDRQTINYVSTLVNQQTLDSTSFNFFAFKTDVLRFVNNMQVPGQDVQFRYSEYCTSPTLYSSVYACMIYSLMGELKTLDVAKKKSWIDYLDSFQNEEDGLFYDPNVENEIYADSDWWGARHLGLHIINAYASLNARPKYEFKFLKKYYDLNLLANLLEQNNDMFTGGMENDFDNKLMNIACLLQYQRDTWKDNEAGEAVKFIQQYLLKNINPVTGIWGDDNLDDPFLRSRKVQFAYHLLPIFLFDKIYDFDFSKITATVLKTQNKFGGFGVPANSSACEDIDSIDILIRTSKFAVAFERERRKALEDGFKWVLTNQMKDGGFVFRLNEQLVYGHEQMSSPKNVGAMFPTWFRTLSIAYLNEYFKLPKNFTITDCPGL